MRLVVLITDFYFYNDSAVTIINIWTLYLWNIELLKNIELLLIKREGRV